jgi:hypothetical protein
MIVIEYRFTLYDSGRTQILEPAKIFNSLNVGKVKGYQLVLDDRNNFFKFKSYWQKHKAKYKFIKVRFVDGGEFNRENLSELVLLLQESRQDICNLLSDANAQLIKIGKLEAAIMAMTVDKKTV